MNLDITATKQLSKSRVEELRILYSRAGNDEERQVILDTFLLPENSQFMEAIIKSYNSHPHPDRAEPTEQAAPLFEPEMTEKSTPKKKSNYHSILREKKFKIFCEIYDELVSKNPTRNFSTKEFALTVICEMKKKGVSIGLTTYYKYQKDYLSNK